MPSKSAKQHRLMEAVAHNPAFAKKVGIPQRVGKEYASADQSRPSGADQARKHHAAGQRMAQSRMKPK